MRKIPSLLAVGSLFAMLSFGDNFSGKLVDANCYTQQKDSAACPATSATSTFALDVSGKLYTLDSTGNSKAATAMKTRANRTSDASKDVVATITGSQSGGTITVDSIDVQ
ncbi:MAG TPA: hypothetical protein VK752_22415 [Bryobacteraceae bacterium]|jgi:hypothetical protein|nr:hypothetical protein [Bryobacteraceae bacterium]